MTRSAKRVVLELLTAAGPPHRNSVANLIAAGEVIGLDEGNIRVALARLVAAGTLEVVGRGEYQLGAGTVALTDHVTRWRELEKQVRRWDGGWACVALGDLGRTDRSALRRRDRALELRGFRELARDLAVRPDNLVGGIAALRARLVELGLPQAAPVFRASELDPETDARARTLWDADRLTASYRQTTAKVERFLGTMHELSSPIAAREAFLFGGDVLRALHFDPVLPEPLVDVAARRALVDAMKRLDDAGRGLWARLFQMPHRLVSTLALPIDARIS